MSESPDRTSDLDRRSVLRRAAAAGLLATPAVGLLSACVGGGDDDDDAGDAERRRQVATTNPLGVKEDAPLEVVIFNGGLGTKYADRRAHPVVQEEVPQGEGQVLQPPRRSPRSCSRGSPAATRRTWSTTPARS